MTEASLTANTEICENKQALLDEIIAAHLIVPER